MSDAFVPVRPDLAHDPDTARVHARVIAGLFGDDEPGARIGRYVVRGKLGQGAAGVVYEAFDEALDRRVAIKLVRTDIDAALVRARLVREGQALARLNHPNVVHVYEVGQDEGRVFVAMELVDGTTLREWVRARPRPWREVLVACIAAGRGLAAVHAQGLTHRDFKPDNVMLGDDHPHGDHAIGRVRVMDFGLARFMDDTPLPRESSTDGGVGAPEATAIGKVVGTPAYMAPEQGRGHVVDARADQFSFCVTVWEALCGRRPALDEDGLATAADGERRVPRWIQAVLRRGLQAEPAARWPDMIALLDALERGRARAHTRRRVFAAVTLASVLGGLGLAHALDRHRRERECVRESDTLAELQLEATPSLAAAAQALASARREACRHAVVDESWDDTDLARALWCLDRDRMRIAAGSSDTLTGDGCLEPHVLARISVPPVDRRDEAHAIAAALTAERAASTADADALARLVERADALDFAALQAETRTLRAETLVRAGQLATATITAKEAYFVAARGDAWAEAGRAAALLGEIVGGASARAGEADAWARAGEADAWARHAAVADELAGRPR